MTEAARTGSDSQRRDVAVPGQVVGVFDAGGGRGVGCERRTVGRGFEFAENCRRKWSVYMYVKNLINFGVL